VFKKISLAVVALVLMVGSVMADEINSSDIANLSTGDDVAVFEGASDIDLDAALDKNDEAVEACFRGWGGWGGYGCYNYCYNYCYTPCYHYCYQPVVYHTYCYRPVCYTTYSYGYLGGWGCY
jgi:hypothetical protein